MSQVTERVEENSQQGGQETTVVRFEAQIVLDALWQRVLPHLTDHQRALDELRAVCDELLDVTAGILYLTDLEGDALYPAMVWPDAQVPAEVVDPDGVYGRALASGEMALTTVLDQVEMVVPLVAEDQPVGVLVLTRLAVDGFEDAEQRAILCIAGSMAHLLHYVVHFTNASTSSQALTKKLQKQAKRLRAERDRADYLYQVTREMTRTLDLERVLNRTLVRVSQALNVRQGSILLLDMDTGYLVYRAAIGRAQVLPRGGKPTHYRRGFGLAGWVLEHNKEAIITGIDEDPRWNVDPEKKGQSQSVLAVPLSSGGDVLGVILLFHPEPDYFNRDHIVFAKAAANHITAAIKNSEMYRLVREQAARLGNMLRQQSHVSAQYTAILASITDGVAVSDEHGKLTVVNDATARILRLDKEPLIGQPLDVLFGGFSDQEQQSVKGMMAEMCEQSRRKECSSPAVVMLHQDEQIIQAACMPMYDERQAFAGTVIVLRDVTREQEIAQAKNEFVSIVAHELRTPMTSIKGYIDLILQGAVGEVNQGQQHFLGIAKSNVDRLSELISDLLDTARIDAGRVRLESEPVQIAELVNGVCESIAETVRERELTLVVEEAPALPVIQADRNRIIQVVTNLLSNAYRYTPPGGEIRVSMGLDETNVWVSVSDTGIGISIQDREKIFEPFYRANQELVSQQTGTGLGLPIVRSLVEMHGGTVTLETELGVGSTFGFTLPIENISSSVSL